MLLLLELETSTQRLTVATPREYLSVCLLHTFPPPTDRFPQHPGLLMGCQCLYTMMVLLSLLLLTLFFTLPFQYPSASFSHLALSTTGSLPSPATRYTTSSPHFYPWGLWRTVTPSPCPLNHS